MFNVGPEKILLILLLALIFLGPKELPEAARKIGRVLAEVRRMSAGFEHELRSALHDVTSEQTSVPESRPAVKPAPPTDDEADQSSPAA